MKTYLAFYPTGSVFFFDCLSNQLVIAVSLAGFTSQYSLSLNSHRENWNQQRWKERTYNFSSLFLLTFPSKFQSSLSTSSSTMLFELLNALLSFDLNSVGVDGVVDALFLVSGGGGGWKRLNKYVPTIMVMCLQWIFYLCWNKNILCWVQRKVTYS